MGHVAIRQVANSIGVAGAAPALWLATSGLVKSKKWRITGNIRDRAVALLAWRADNLLSTSKAVLHFSSIKLTDHDSLAFLGKPLGPGQAFYRFQMFDSNRIFQAFW